MPQTDAQKRAKAKWDKEHMTTVGVKVTRAVADSFAAACDMLGVTRGQVLREAVDKTIAAAKEKDGEKP